MAKLISLFVLLFSSLAAISQTNDTVSAPGQNNSAAINDTTVYTTVDTPASFPGGRTAWNKFVEQNLNAAVGIDNGAKKGTYNVVIKFTVTKEGTLKDFEPVTHYKHGFEEEVIRVLKLSSPWIPAKKNGVIVNSRTQQKQVFIISVG
ncbi:MAG: hypothetical protein JSU05_09665 [Bacteroidetes bacterium]|nr:hypothetical protein [Bacteroidota bacterium]